MEIIKATLEDIPQLCQLLNSLFQQETEFLPDENAQIRGLTTILCKSEVGHIIVAKESNKIIAMVNILYTVSTALGERVGILEDMVVSQDYRNQGVGSKLIKFAIKFAKGSGCKRLTLLTDEDNNIAHKFYIKEGFSRSTMVPFRIMLNDD
ncbi:GNAT family N-acetyltransferase [Candidatus Sulfurimonas marisnigri]|uniref:GNAT family N-acetyltransferase n=1 Tax=Candidatus Sulfurimonas marisnigri TaxID=2740405 RepID=A0A7S7RPN7_9BACT|nr:GNAT family N-acetyltransferase [Candidatus Sulfurimonas marisnigri]QOY53801.1 GNAT family N-acetyltransferase [Candidatus Sulfurimonas marisnigri]